MCDTSTFILATTSSAVFAVWTCLRIEVYVPIPFVLADSLNPMVQIGLLDLKDKLIKTCLAELVGEV
jgi:hypothetical protein